MNRLKLLVGPMRVDFLYLDVACVALGTATANWTAGQINAREALLVLVGATCAHISVNTLNEYFDFRSGLDLRSDRTPFSGGSGTLMAHPDLARATLGLGLSCLALSSLIGLYFVILRGWAIFPLGLLGMVTIVAYTPWITRRPFVSLIVTGLGFGLLMINGVSFALTGTYTWAAFLASLTPFFLGNCLLLLNQFPDIRADAGVGRRNLPIVYGRQKSSIVYGVILAATYTSNVMGVALEVLPAWSLLGLVTVPLAAITARGVYRHAEEMPRLMPFMGFNVLLNLITPLAMAIGIWIAS